MSDDNSQQITPDEIQGEETKSDPIADLTNQIADLKNSMSKQNKAFYAMRTDNKRLQEENQQLKSQPTTVTQQTATIEEKTDINPEDLDYVKKLARQAGFVTQEELLQKEQQIREQQAVNLEQEAINEFCSNHPEYDEPESWDQLVAVYKRDYNVKPSSKKGYLKMLKGIHEELSGGSGDSIDKIKQEAQDELRAQQKTNDLLSVGGAGGSRSASKDSNKSDFEALSKKYPNLSKEQIKAQIESLNQLYPDS